MLRNTDGTPYQLGSLQLFDPTNPMHELFDEWDQAAIEQGGSPILYYEIIIPPGAIDPVYREARNKLFSPIPVQLWSFYEPTPNQFYQDIYGINSKDEQLFEFNRTAVLKAIGHFPKIGSQLFSPHRRENWTIVDIKTSEFQYWGEIRLQMIAERYQASVTQNDGQDAKRPDFEIKS